MLFLVKMKIGCLMQIAGLSLESGVWSPTCGALSVSHNGAAGLVDSVTFGLINCFAFLVFDDAALLDLFCLTDLLLIKWLNISVCILGIWQYGNMADVNDSLKTTASLP